MPQQLDFARLTPANHGLVQNFDCGTEHWSVLINQWVKAPQDREGALYSIAERGNEVFLFFLGNDLVGIGSLGVTNWRLPPPDGPNRKLAYIPVIAVASQYRGQPLGQGETKFCDQIMGHLIGTASQNQDWSELGLRVMPENDRAIAFYKRFDFHDIGIRDNYLRMIRLLR
jgi:ribosomal protein S18 acetylase RimI-like enzyme